ncbi:MAG: hypothetical protein ABH837_02725 [bacterium]
MTRIIGILILILLMAGTIWYVIYLGTASESEISAKEVVVESVDTNIVDQNVLNQLDDLKPNGKLPVTVSPEEIGKNSPFTP